MNKIELGELSNPRKFHSPLDISKSEIGLLLKQLRTMIIIRKAEEKLAEKITDGSIKCPCHLGIGQEAIAVGLARNVRKTDRVFGAHRSHSHFLAINEDLFGLFAEVLGKETGSSKGMGGSMHLIDQSNGFMGSVPIVGATIPIATGAALAAKLDRKGDIAVSYFGDGATEEGAFHESLNLASTHDLPVLYICENNLFSSHLNVSLRQPSDCIARYADAHQINRSVIDGNDVVTMTSVCHEAIAYIRRTGKPYFIEAVTYRWRGHVGPREDMDVGVKRKDDLNLWKKRDPIGRLIMSLMASGEVSQDQIDNINKEIDLLIEAAWDKAEEASFPEERALLDLVYSNKEHE
jgi:pyruvate dehydrogenase E1 component alpha subunit